MLGRITTFDGIAGVIAPARDSKTLGVLAFQMFIAFDGVIAFVGTFAIHGHALIIRANVMLLLTTAKERITFVIARALHDKAGRAVVRTFRVFATIEERRTFVAAGPLINETHAAPVVADEMLRIITVGTVDTFVGATSWKLDARQAYAGKVTAYVTCKVRITEFPASVYVRNSNAENPLALCILKTIDIILTITDAIARNEEALIIRANVMVTIIVAAAEEDITLICSPSGNRNTGTIIGADGVFATCHDIAAFIAARAIYGDTLVITVTSHVLLTGTIFIGYAVIATGLTGLHTSIVLAHRTRGVAAECRITCVVTGPRKNNALRPLTHRVLITGDVVGAFVVGTRSRRRAILCNTGVALANVVLWRSTAAYERITFIASVTGDSKTGGIVIGAFRMLTTINGLGAVIGTRTSNGNTLILVIAFVVGACIAAINRIAGIGTATGNGLTGIAITFQVTATGHLIAAGIVSGTGNGNTLITVVTFRVLFGITTKYYITFVGTGDREKDTGRIIFCAFSVVATGKLVAASVATRTVLRDALVVFVTDHVLLARAILI